MLTLGSFSPSTPFSPLNDPRVIWRTPPKTPAPAPAPSSTIPVNRLPSVLRIAPPTTVIGDPVISTPTVFTAPAGATPPPPTQTPAGTGTGGTTDTPPPTDNSRLIDLLAAMFKPQDVAGGMAPVSFAPTDGGGATTTDTSGGSKMPLLLLGVAVGGGAWWYFKHKRAA